MSIRLIHGTETFFCIIYVPFFKSKFPKGSYCIMQIGILLPLIKGILIPYFLRDSFGAACFIGQYGILTMTPATVCSAASW